MNFIQSMLIVATSADMLLRLHTHMLHLFLATRSQWCFLAAWLLQALSLANLVYKPHTSVLLKHTSPSRKPA